MKKLLSIVLLAVLAFNTKAQTKDKEAFDALVNTMNEMETMLAKDYTMMTTALDAVNGVNFTMGDCMVLGAYADEGYKKQCKQTEEEFMKTFSKSVWRFEKYNEMSQSLVKVTTQAGQTESSTYSGFAGDATVNIPNLIQGINIKAYFYQSKTDKNKYIMMFPISQMGLFVEMNVNKAKVAPTTTKDIIAEPSNTSAGNNVTVPSIQQKTNNTIKPKATETLKNNTKKVIKVKGKKLV